MPRLTWDLSKYTQLYVDAKFTGIYFECQPSYDGEIDHISALLLNLYLYSGLTYGWHSLQP